MSQYQKGKTNLDFTEARDSEIPAISKLFESILLRLYDSFLTSDSLQYGFKKNSSCKCFELSIYSNERRLINCVLTFLLHKS